MKLGLQVGLGIGHIVLDGDPGPLPQRGTAPQFSVHICCGQMAGWIKMPLGRTVSLDPSDIVLDGDPAPPPQNGGQSPQFSAHVYCGQTAAWIKMPPGMDVGHGPGHIVLDGGPAPPPQKGGRAPNFRPMSIVAKRCMDQDATWYDGRPRPGQHCVRCGPSSTNQGAQSSPVMGTS